MDVFLVDAGVLGEPVAVQPDITRQAVARAAGVDVDDLAAIGVRPLNRWPAVRQKSSTACTPKVGWTPSLGSEAPVARRYSSRRRSPHESKTGMGLNIPCA